MDGKGISGAGWWKVAPGCGVQAGSGPVPRNLRSRVGVSPEMSGFSSLEASTPCQGSKDLPWVPSTSEVKWLAQSHRRAKTWS